MRPPALRGTCTKRFKSLWWLQQQDGSCWQRNIPRNTKYRRHLKGGRICADSSLFSALQHCLQAWPCRQRRKLRFQSTWAFNQFARGATTIMRLTRARPTVSTARDISTTASSLAWGHGLVGDTATAGAATVSWMAEGAGIEVAAERQRRAVIMAAGRQFAPAVEARRTAMLKLLMQGQRGPARFTRRHIRQLVPRHRIANPTPQPRIAAADMRAAEENKHSTQHLTVQQVKSGEASGFAAL